MSEYNGAAELIADDGTVIAEVEVHLLSDPNPGLGSWSGHIMPGEFGDGDWMEATKIRIEDGNEGDIVMTSEHLATTTIGTVRDATFQGSGPPPF